MEIVLALMILMPLAGAALNGLVVRTPFPRRAGVIATLCAAVSFVCAVCLFSKLISTGTPIRATTDWFTVGSLRVNWGFSFDWLTAVMALVVTGIGTLIHLYSIGYMADERTPYRYFAYLNFFLFNMLVLICADNLPVLFVGWEGVGLCSYLLIGYWYTDLEKSNAGMKAFIANRIGDAGMLLGIFACFALFNTLVFSEMAAMMPRLEMPNLILINVAALFLFIGATGKSAQIPLYVWLPDAMAGPTPVSALIHAATMVTAGLYLIIRMNFLFDVAGDTRLCIAIIGSATALLSALIATSQTDIKKVLAYSTVSQLGLMFLGLGMGAYVASLFHVVTHAFFKALLFLGAGSVIHGLHGEQDVTKMGGLRQWMPKTHITFLIGTIAICGIPPLSGFFSKDMILFSTLLNGQWGFYFVGLGVSLLTAYYMARVYALTFLGSYRGPESVHAHESPPVMLIPLFVLAVGSIFAGLLSFPHDLHLLPNFLGNWLAPVIPLHEEHHAPIGEIPAMGIATLVAVVGTATGLLYFTKNATKAVPLPLRPLHALFANKFWIDELYGLVILKPFELLCRFLAKVIDPHVIDAAVLLPAKLSRAGSTVLSFVQTGSAQFYLLIMLLGALGVFWFSLRGVLL